MYCARAGRCVRVLEAEITVRVPRQKRSSKGVHRARPQSATSHDTRQSPLRLSRHTHSQALPRETSPQLASRSLTSIAFTHPTANADRWMAIRTNAAPSNSGSRTTTPRPRRASSWTASSLSRATVSVASSENFTRAAGGRQPHTGFVRSGVRYMTLRATFFMKIVCEKCGPFIEDLSFSDIQVIHPPLSDILSPLRYSSPGSLAGGAGVDGFPPKAKAAW